MRKILLICGPSGSGKGTVADYLEKYHGAIVYAFSEPLHAILRDLDIPNTRANLARLSRSLRQHLSPDILGIGARSFVESHPAGLLVLEGIRRVESLSGWRDKIDAIIWIESSADMRYARSIARGEKSDEHLLTRAEFDQEDQLESEGSLGGLRDIADIVIENDGTLEALSSKIDTFLSTQN